MQTYVLTGRCCWFELQYAFNLFSHNAPMTETGYNEEEMKMVKETCKILNAPNINISATCIRVRPHNLSCLSFSLLSSLLLPSFDSSANLQLSPSTLYSPSILYSPSTLYSYLHPNAPSLLVLLGHYRCIALLSVLPHVVLSILHSPDTLPPSLST